MINYVQRDVCKKRCKSAVAYLSLGEKRVLSFIHNRILFSTNVIDKFSLVVYMATIFS